MAGANVVSSNAGIKSLVYAVMTDTVEETYAAIKPLPGLISCKVSPNTDSAELYADNMVVEIATIMGKADVEIEMQDFNGEAQADFFGHTIDTIKGTVKCKTTDIAPYVAIGYEKTKTNGKSRFVWLYKVKFEPIESDDKTQEDKANFGTAKIKGVAIANNAYEWKITCDEDSLGAESTTFLTQVGGV